MLGGLQQGCTLLHVGTLSGEPSLWLAARLGSALAIPAGQRGLEGAHGHRAAGKVHETVRAFGQWFVARHTLSKASKKGFS